jgi:hypothetical protein
MSAPVAPLTLKDKVKETPEQKAARKAAQAAMTPEQRAAFVLEKEKLKAKEAEEKAKLQAAKGYPVTLTQLSLRAVPFHCSARSLG